jgi:hypothetical protein
MPATLFLDEPLPAPQQWPAVEPLPVNIDAALLHGAMARWRQASDELRELFAGVPSTRATLTDFLHNRFDLGAPSAGLRFSAAEPHPEQFVDFVQAWAFVYQHPRLDTALDRPCVVSGLHSSHALARQTPLQLLTRLHKLNPQEALDQGWNRYWDGRAPDTPVSRRERASQLYRLHLQATAEVALAQRTLTSEQLRPLWLLMDDTRPNPRLDEQPLHNERLDLLLSNNTRVTLPDAWVISVGDPQTGQQLLYLPKQPVPLQAFARRRDMEAWLTRQGLVPKGLPASGLRFEYSARTLPLTKGMTDLLKHLQQARLAALRSHSASRSGLAEHGARALEQADRLDRQRSVGGVFAAPPVQPADLADDEPALFGALHADIPWALRQAAVQQQQQALENWAKQATQAQRSTLDKLLQTLEAAERKASSAAHKLLYRERVLDVTTFNREFTALHQAHRQGLLAEAELQHTLQQLSDDEYRDLKVVLAQTTSDSSGPCAATLSLAMSEQDGERTHQRRQTLNGPLVITDPRVLSDPHAPHSLLLYWPGSGGGLQRLANRQALEQQLFKMPAQDATLSLHLSRIVGDPLQHALNEVSGEFDEQAAGLRQRYRNKAQAAQRAEQLEILRQRFHAIMQVPVNGARQVAYAHLQGQHRSATLGASLPDWLSQLSTEQRSTLKQLLERYIKAMQRSHALLEIALPARDEFTRQRLHARLRKDFSLKGTFSVQLDLPDSVAREKHTVAAPGAPGTPVKLELVPSKARGKMSLEALAQMNLDNTPSMSLEPLLLRLGFMRVEVTASSEAERQTLVSGITKPYLLKVLPELDLPKAYEELIRQVFSGSSDEPLFVNAHRRECLLEPWRLMLRLQFECAVLRKHIEEGDLTTLERALDPDLPGGWNIVLQPAFLSVGGKDTPQEGPVTLAGVTFIEENVSGRILLYLPDSPDGRFLRPYRRIEEARQGLFQLCAQDQFARYLAGRALQGNVRAHESRIGQAVAKNFDGLIGVGHRWPPGTSLAEHLLNVHMGRLIEAHRGTSRSNDALYLERYALSGPRAFNYLKMALGLVPFVGTAIALYDAWTSANQAVAAFLRGQVGDGVAEIEAVLLSLIDAAMDILPSLGVAGGSGSARAVARTRQLRQLSSSVSALQEMSARQARRVIERFAGYEYPRPVYLFGQQPDSSGFYRNIYRHADGNFIVRQGRIYQVEPSTDSRGWRLSGTAQKTYKQPIALDDFGQWDTYYAIYGTAFDGGGLGGGNLLVHLANTLDPLWPLAMRERLPRWWAEQGYRRQKYLTRGANELGLEMETQYQKSKQVLDDYTAARGEARAALRRGTEAVCLADIDMASRRYAMLAELLPMTRGNKRRTVLECMSQDAWKVTDRKQFLVHCINHQVLPLLERIDALIDRLNALPDNTLRERLGLLGEIRTLRLQNMQFIDQTEVLMHDLQRWYERIGVAAHKAQIRMRVEPLSRRLSDNTLLYLRTSNLLEIVKRYDNVNDMSWLFLQRQAQDLRAKVDRALYVHISLDETVASTAQRNRILQDCLATYTQYLREMRVWTTSTPQHFHMAEVPALLAGVEKMAERARQMRQLPTTQPLAGEIRKKVFTTDDGQVLIGVEHWEPTTQKRQYHLTGKGGLNEIWEQDSNGSFRLLNPPAPVAAPSAQELTALLAETRSRLAFVPTYEAKVKAYAEQDMLPVDLEHMLVSEAEELLRRARHLEALDGQNALIGNLRDKADELKASGRQLRTAQALKSRHPTDGMLADLLEQNAVQARKLGELKNLGKRRDGRNDYLQEYEILDLTKTPAELLWYAHFHYSKATPGLREFEKAHLKLPEHRSITHADDPSLPYADIGKQSALLTHLENL